jgi:hypothetical protein
MITSNDLLKLEINKLQQESFLTGAKYSMQMMSGTNEITRNAQLELLHFVQGNRKNVMLCYQSTDRDREHQ